MHDPRIGRFFAVDPLASEYPWYTPYQFAGNMPIAAIDLDGLEELAKPTTAGKTNTGKEIIVSISNADEFIVQNKHEMYDKNFKIETVIEYKVNAEQLDDRLQNYYSIKWLKNLNKITD